MVTEKTIPVRELWDLEGRNFPVWIHMWGLLDILEKPYDHMTPTHDLIEDVIDRGDTVEVCTANNGDWEVSKEEEVTVVWGF